MTVIRRGKRPQDHFTIVANEAVRDASLPWESLGLLVWLLSHNEGWETSERQIATLRSAGRAAVRSMVKPLEESGYLVREQSTPGDGKFGRGVWIVTDIPTVVRLTDRGLTDRGQSDHKEEHPKEDDPQEPFALELVSEIGEPAARGVPFDSFWAQYPHKRGKSSAVKHWAKLNDKERGSAIDAIVNYALDCELNGRKHQQGDTYLSKRTWEDHMGVTLTPTQNKAGRLVSDVHECGRSDCSNGWVFDDSTNTVVMCSVEQPQIEGQPDPDKKAIGLPARRDLD